MASVESIPWWAGLALAVGSAVVSAFVPSILPAKYHALAFYAGLILVCIGLTVSASKIQFVKESVGVIGAKWIIIIGVAIIISGVTLYLSVPKNSASNSPLSIIAPSHNFIRTIRIIEKGGNKWIYRNFYLLGVQNRLSNKTIRNLKLQFLLLDTPHELKLNDDERTSVDLNPGDTVYFQIGHIDSRDKLYLMLGSREVSKEEFKGIYHNAGLGIFSVGNENAKSAFKVLPKNMSNISKPVHLKFQFSANDTPPLFVDLIVSFDDEHQLHIGVKTLE